MSFGSLGKFPWDLRVGSHFISNLYTKKYKKNVFFTKIDKDNLKKYSFDEIPKTQMPEGTLNRTFCLSKIHFF